MRKLLILVLFMLWAVPASEILSPAEVFAQVDTAWVRRYNGPADSTDYGYAIAVDGSGNVYVTGDSYGSGTSQDWATIKYYPNGDTAWVRRYNGPGNDWDYASAIVVDGSGNVYVTGGGHGGSETWDDYATVKYYPNGDTAWVRRYNGPGNGDDYANAIAVDASGNVFVTGQSEGNGTWDDYATIKYYSNGDTEWVKRYNGPGDGHDRAYAIAVDDSNNVYVTGESGGSGTYVDYATIKYYPNGDTAWMRRYNGPANNGDYARAIAVDGSGNVYVTGYSYGSGTGGDYATIKYYPNGDTAWVRRYDNGPLDYPTAIAIDGSGNVYVTGFSYDVETGEDYATIKYYSNGDTAWVRRYNGPENMDDLASALAIDGSGNIYVTGQSEGNGTSYDYATIKYDPDGNELWVQRYNGSGNSTDYGYAIAVDGSGNVYVTGGVDGEAYLHGSDYATIKYVDLSAPPEILSLCPNNSANLDGIYITIEGYRFDTLASVKLVESGVPEDSIIGSNMAVVSYNTKIICRFDLAGQPIGSVWDLVVTNPNWKADTLFSAFTLVSPSELSTKDVLCVLSSNHERIQDFQANAKAWSKFNGEPLDSIIHSVSLYKAPDKVKNIDYDNNDTTQAISTVINRGWWQYEIDPETGEAYETNLLQVAQMTPSEFAGLNFYDPDNFLFHHYVTVKEIHEYPDSMMLVLEAIPKRAEWTYSKLELEIDYIRGLVVNSIVYSDTLGQQTVTTTEEQLYDGIWVATKSIKTTTDTSETLQTEIELSNIQINVGIPDSVFEVNEGKLSTSGTEPESTYQEFQVPILPKNLSGEWNNPNVYKPNPILFLHGFASGSPESWENTMQTFRAAMYPYYADDISWYVYCPNFQIYPGANASIDGPDGWGYATCAEIIGRLNNFNSVPEDYRPQKVNLVAHSMGGLGARECVTGYSDFYHWVYEIITTGTPHLGSPLANIGKGVVAEEKASGWAAKSSPAWITTNVIRIAVAYVGIDLGGEAVADMSIGSPFLDNLYSRYQYAQEIGYYAIAGIVEGSWAPIFGPDDGVVSRKSQLGIGEPGGHNFYQYLRGTAEIQASHGEEPTKSFAPILSFLDPKPNVLITTPEPDDSIAEACTLQIELHNEYLPATSQLFVTMTRLGDPPIADFQDYFRPDTSWRAEGPNSIKSGRYDTAISVSKAPPGKYVITVRVRNPAGYEDEASVEITLGVDLMTDIGGGQARRNMNKIYGISYGNIGSAKASNVTLETALDPRVNYVSSSPPGNVSGNTVSWDFDSLAAGESGNASVTVFIPWSVDQGEILQASSNITTTDEDVDPSNNTAEDPEQVVGSYDPNDKVVYPTGVGAKGYIAEGQRLRYTVYFENDSSATAEAIDIVVVDTLDFNLNWSSLKIGPMSHPDECSGSFDPVAGVITWECESIMLPPNDNPPEGEGWFTFAISPQYLQHGTEIRNRASIQFDNNPWIYAPEDSSFIINTMDEYPPNSRVTALWDTVSAIAFEVNWKGRDDSLGFGSGVESYTIYVSDNGGLYDIWIADTSDTFATFYGELGHSYCFYSIARDSVGNVEDAPLEADACTRSPIYILGDVNTDGIIELGDVVFLINYLFRAGPAPEPLWLGDANCDDLVELGDVVYLINYLFRGGPSPDC